MREVAVNILMIAQAVVFFGHLGLILVYKEVTICEPNLAILLFEMAFLGAIIAFGGFNIVKLTRR